MINKTAFFMLFFYPFVLFGEENIVIKIITDTPLWSSATSLWYPETQGKAVGIAERDTILLSGFSDLQAIKIQLNNKDYWIQADAAIPAYSEELFERTWLTDFQDKNRKHWLLLYNLAVLKSKDRNTYYEYEKGWIDEINETEVEEWYSIVSFDDSLQITQTALHIGGFSRSFFMIKNIIQIEGGYRIDAIPWTGRILDIGALAIKWPNRMAINPSFIRDGDYMDMLLDDKLIATFVSVDNRVMQELQSLIATNSCDLSDITWPRRSDGSMDYPPPQDMSGYTATHRTLDRLRLRDTANTSSKIVTTLPQDTAVQLLETGQETTIDGITAPWVRVLSSTGYEGWCFSGYLEPIAAPPSPSPEPPAIEPYTADPPPLVESTAHTFPWIWIAAGSAVMLTAGAVIVIIVKKKKH